VDDILIMYPPKKKDHTWNNSATSIRFPLTYVQFTSTYEHKK
jgi:hypothetical protein